MEKIFLISRPDRIGDVVLSTHLPVNIKSHFPESKVYMLLREYTRDIYLNNPYVDGIIIFDQKEGIFSLASKFRDLGITHALMLLPNERINYALALAGVRYRIGSGFKPFHFITNVKSVYRRGYDRELNEGQYCSDMLRKLGIPVNSEQSVIYLSDEEKKEVSKIRKELIGDCKTLTGVHYSSGGSAPNMPPEEYLLLAEHLKKMSGTKVVFTDNVPSDKIKEAGFTFINENLPLRKSILNFAALDFLVSASTGTMHIAGALGVKTIGLFCPLPACKPSLWGTLGNKARYILPDESYCSRRCPGDPKKCDFAGEGGIDHLRVANVLREELLS